MKAFFSFQIFSQSTEKFDVSVAEPDGFDGLPQKNETTFSWMNFLKNNPPSKYTFKAQLETEVIANRSFILQAREKKDIDRILEEYKRIQEGSVKSSQNTQQLGKINGILTSHITLDDKKFSLSLLIITGQKFTSGSYDFDGGYKKEIKSAISELQTQLESAKLIEKRKDSLFANWLFWKEGKEKKKEEKVPKQVEKEKDSAPSNKSEFDFSKHLPDKGTLIIGTLHFSLFAIIVDILAEKMKDNTPIGSGSPYGEYRTEKYSILKFQQTVYLTQQRIGNNDIIFQGYLYSWYNLKHAQHERDLHQAFHEKQNIALAAILVMEGLYFWGPKSVKTDENKNVTFNFSVTPSLSLYGEKSLNYFGGITYKF